MKEEQLLKTHKGLTIIELMVAISIISIIAMFAVSTYSNYTTRAKIAAELTVLSPQSLEVYELKKNN